MAELRFGDRVRWPHGSGVYMSKHHGYPGDDVSIILPLAIGGDCMQVDGEPCVVSVPTSQLRMEEAAKSDG